MVTIVVDGFEAWRAAARRLMTHNVDPGGVSWEDASSAHSALPFGDGAVPAAAASTPAAPRVPRAFVALARLAACHRDPRKWDALYRLLWRVAGERALLEIETDDDVRTVREMAAQVRRDEHKMRAFVRFSPVESADGRRWIAWYQPDHHIVRRAAPFFADRFASMRWSILTPDESAHWDGSALTFTAGMPAPAGDASGDVEELWRVYYASVFNPARVNPKAMAREMPRRRWQRLSEATIIPGLVAGARERTGRLAVAHTDSARPFVPPDADLPGLRSAASSCLGCPLAGPATQVVFGEGPADATMVLVGEQPGDAEDLAGRPFVGPAGNVLDAALAAAGLDRERLYVTNAVKHFAFEPRGKRRIHRTPRLSELQACRPWLEAELQRLRPATIVALGSSAARALLGPQARVMALRGRVIAGSPWAPRLIVTIHPSAVLRSDDQGTQYFDMIVSDLRLAAETQAIESGGRMSLNRE